MRVQGGHAFTPNLGLVMAGGLGPSFSNTDKTEQVMIANGETKIRSLPNLPGGMVRNCMATLSDDKVVVLASDGPTRSKVIHFTKGGFISLNWFVCESSTSFSGDTEWKYWPDTIKTHNRAVCGVVKNAIGKRFLMVAGGRWDEHGMSHKMTEVLDLQVPTTWATGKSSLWEERESRRKRREREREKTKREGSG